MESSSSSDPERTPSPEVPRSGCMSPIRKRPKMSLSATEKLMIMNAYKYHYKYWPQEQFWSIAACMDKTAEVLGVSSVTVKRIVRERKLTGTFRPPKKGGPRSEFATNLDQNTYTAIRRIIQEFFHKNEIPTLVKVQEAMKEDDSLPKLTTTELQKVFKDLKIKYEDLAGKNNSVIIKMKTASSTEK